MFDRDVHDNYAGRILNVKSKQVDINKVASDQKLINPNQHQDLQHGLAKYDKLFGESLGVYPHQKVHIELFLNLEHFHYCVHPVPCVHDKRPKKNLNTW